MEIRRNTFFQTKRKNFFLSYDEFHKADSFLQVETNEESEKQVDSKDINIHLDFCEDLMGKLS